ncbi:hypothetical protein ACTHGN_001772 [Pseudomonas putida]
MRDYTYNYWLRPSSDLDLIVVSQGEIKDSLALDILNSVAPEVSRVRPSIFVLNSSERGFTHVFVIPSNFHGYLKGNDGVVRDKLFLCLPIFRCEFSGRETTEEFKELRLHYVPTLDWQRQACPKLRVYFDNPQTGGGTDGAGVFLKWADLLREIDALDGISNGFIEVANWRDEVIEITSPGEGEYILIRNRKDEQALSVEGLFDEIKIFAFA